MPFSPRSYLRRLPFVLLRRHLSARAISAPTDFDWDQKRAPLTEELLLILDAAGQAGDRFNSDAERISMMADQVGQAALRSVFHDRIAELEALPSGLARAATTFLDDLSGFGRAEGARFTDAKRRSVMWDGYVLAPHLEFNSSPEAVAGLKTELSRRFRSPNIAIDIFERRRVGGAGPEDTIVQMIVYREGQLEEPLEFFEDGALGARPRRPVLEAALTYQPETGELEVVVEGGETREAFAHICAEHLLQKAPEERLPFRQFDLSGILKPHRFDTAPEDRIESVSVDMIRLMPLDTEAERVVLQIGGRQRRSTIWEMADSRFGDRSPLSGGWMPTQAQLTIRFHKDSASGRSRTLPVTITMPHRCDLKERTDRERLIGQKYLAQWGLMRSA